MPWPPTSRSNCRQARGPSISAPMSDTSSIPTETDHAGVAAVMASPQFAAALATLRREHDRTVADIVRLTEIPSPPFGEERRAAA